MEFSLSDQDDVIWRDPLLTGWDGHVVAMVVTKVTLLLLPQKCAGVA